ncbi:hypothetical protein JR547_002877 [Listeria monocytogenes serotype 1/2a]|nr:hypothetical protein [Listeria monocytogenes serotype 1/2a]
MNMIWLQGLLWMVFLFCLFCLRRWHKNKANVTHKYKALIFCVTIYGLYRTNFTFYEAVISQQTGIWIPCLGILVCLNFLLYVQIVRLLTPKIMQVITTIFSPPDNDRSFTILFQIIYLTIGFFIWIQGVEKAINYYQLDTVSYTVQELWGFVYASLYALFPVVICTLIIYQINHINLHVVKILSLYILVFIFSLSAPGWLLIVQEKPILIFGMIVGFQEWLMYLLVKKKIQKEMRYFDVEMTMDPTTIRVGSNETKR